jgi:GT2 family glycosyltransferase
MITASIVAYKTDIEELKQVISCTANSIVEIIYIVDNSPSDGLKVIADYSGKVEYIFNNANLGYGKAHNIAIRKSIEKHSEYHIIINPDISFEKGVVETLKKFMDDNRDIGHVMPKIVYPNGELQYLCKLLPDPFYLMGRRFIPDKWVNSRNIQYELRFTGYKTVMEVPSLSGCFMFLRTSVLKDTGGFDESFFMYMEDVDLCRRIGNISKTCFYPYVTVCHKYRKESYKNTKLMKCHIKSAIKYFNKWGWIVDKKREKVNRKVLNEFNYNSRKYNDSVHHRRHHK